MFFDIGAPEIIVILIVAVILLGPEKLPEAGRAVGRALRDFRSMTSDLTRDFREPIEEIKQPINDLKRYKDWDAWEENQPEAQEQAATQEATATSSTDDDSTSEPSYPAKKNLPGPV